MTNQYTIGDVLRVSIDRIRVDPTRLEAKDTATLDVDDVDKCPPIKVKLDSNGEYFTIVNGHHRYRTALQQGKAEMSILIAYMSGSETTGESKP